MHLFHMREVAAHVEVRATAATLNNDAAILLLTPLVVRLIRRRYPDRTDLVIPFAFAVFMAAGVAPLVVSNPKNMVVADFSGIGFNTFAARMIPIAIAGWAVAFVILRWSFRRVLTRPGPDPRVSPVTPSTPAQRS